MANIFISYRREDSTTVTGCICDRLKSHFGSRSIFMDTDGIPLGVDFRQHLNSAVSKCKVLLVVIGENWLQIGQDGRSRLDDPADFVRVEIEAALRREIPVIPVLIGRMTIPSIDQLPPTLAELVHRQATHIDPGIDFNVHIEHLIRGLDLLFRKARYEKIVELLQTIFTTIIVITLVILWIAVKLSVVITTDTACYSNGTVDSGYQEIPLVLGSLTTTSIFATTTG